ncbi:hypothetical protein CVV65_15225 [Kyrpidia spormannii]|uniref:ABC transporter domain-containing protein n=1 Tax=Kyrpidia spormannii TaxID=2055160 RepID=A0A2K8NC22_9BACL|nr:ABC transporter ATP-binding protein [Kyrpidia spormannii]ATY86110.1 hypothetical protein CVV65_15225 [Kyrpidia spormannii]
MEPILRIDRVSLSFGGVKAVNKVSLNVYPGQILGLIGPNGAGKSTLFNIITGLYKPSEGRIFFKGRDITGEKPHKITALGISRTFQNIRLLMDRTVFENILVAFHRQCQYSLVQTFFITRTFKQAERQVKERALQLLDSFGLASTADTLVEELPQGIQRRIEIVRAVATGADLIFLDEPAAGLNAIETKELIEVIKRLNREGKTIILIEHDMKLVKEVCEEIAVLHYGQLLRSGTFDTIRSDPLVIQAYLGRQKEHA